MASKIPDKSGEKKSRVYWIYLNPGSAIAARLFQINGCNLWRIYNIDVINGFTKGIIKSTFGLITMNLFCPTHFMVLISLYLSPFDSACQSVLQIKVQNKTNYQLVEMVCDYSVILGIDTIFLKVSNQPSDRKAPEAYLKVINRYQFEIILKKGLSKSILSRVIFHEMVHIQQIKSGKLLIVNNSFYWNGSRYHAEKINYNGRPWRHQPLIAP